MWGWSDIRITVHGKTAILEVKYAEEQMDTQIKMLGHLLHIVQEGIITASTEEFSSWEVSSHPGSQEIPRPCMDN